MQHSADLFLFGSTVCFSMFQPFAEIFFAQGAPSPSPAHPGLRGAEGRIGSTYSVAGTSGPVVHTCRSSSGLSVKSIKLQTQLAK